jgi:hypothetical protein
MLKKFVLEGVQRKKWYEKVRDLPREKRGILFSQSLKPFSHLFWRCISYPFESYLKFSSLFFICSIEFQQQHQLVSPPSQSIINFFSGFNFDLVIVSVSSHHHETLHFLVVTAIFVMY